MNHLFKSFNFNFISMFSKTKTFNTIKRTFFACNFILIKHSNLKSYLLLYLLLYITYNKNNIVFFLSLNLIKDQTLFQIKLTEGSLKYNTNPMIQFKIEPTLHN